MPKRICEILSQKTIARSERKNYRASLCVVPKDAKLCALQREKTVIELLHSRFQTNEAVQFKLISALLGPMLLSPFHRQTINPLRRWLCNKR